MTVPTILPGGLRPADATIAQAVGDEVVLLNLDSGIYFSLNEVGALVWRRLEAGESPAAITTRIADEFEIAPAQADDDVQAFLRALLEKGLVVAR